MLSEQTIWWIVWVSVAAAVVLIGVRYAVRIRRAKPAWVPNPLVRIPNAIKERWQFLWVTQLRRKRGVVVTGLPATYGIGNFYDWAVAQFAPEPDKWPRFYDLVSFMPWWAWMILLVGISAVLAFEGGFRASQSKDETILALKQEIADREGPSVLPLTVEVDPPESGVAGKYRFRVHNPTDDPVTKVYGKYRRYRAINRPIWRSRWLTKLPFDGMDLPWDDARNGTSTTTDIGAHSSEYLLIGVESMRSFRHYGPNKRLAPAHNALNGGTYEFILEIGSKTSGTPITRSVRIEFSNLDKFDVKIIPPTPDIESESHP